jgi:hypothetical protein
LHKVTRENLWEKTVRIKDLSLLWNLLLREIFVSIFRQQAVRWLKKSEKKKSKLKFQQHRLLHQTKFREEKRKTKTETIKMQQ